MRIFLALIPALLLPAFALAQACPAQPQAVDTALAELQQSYQILSDIGCGTLDPSQPAHALLCESAWENGLLWKMAQLDDAAYVYAYENATGSETNHDDPPRDTAFIASRDSCTTEACLCAAYMAHTRDSLGGMSPY